MNSRLTRTGDESLQQRLSCYIEDEELQM